MSGIATVPKTNGQDFSHAPPVDDPIPEPKEPLQKRGKILDAHGDTVKPTMTQPKNPNVIQIPQWAATTFGTFILVIGFYAVSFYNQTNSAISNLSEKVNSLMNAQDEKRKAELKEMLDNAVKRGYELKAAEGDHGQKEKR